MDVLSVKFNKVGLGHRSYIITIPMPEGRSDYIFLKDNNDIEKVKTTLQKDGGYIKDHGIVTDVEKQSCVITRTDGSMRNLFFVGPQDLSKFKGHLCLHACKDIAHYMCVSTYTLGFQKMRVTWDAEGYPYLELDKKTLIRLIPYRSVSPDGLGMGSPGFAEEYCVDAFAPHVIEKRLRRNRENDTGSPIPF